MYKKKFRYQYSIFVSATSNKKKTLTKSMQWSFLAPLLNVRTHNFQPFAHSMRSDPN